MIFELRPGDEVAIMPEGKESPEDVVAISRIDFITESVIRLAEGSFYDRWHGSDTAGESYIVAATPAHIAAIQRKGSAQG